MLKNILVGQSGGPTAVINSSLYGVIEEGLRNKEKIGTVYGMVHGIEGFLAGNFINLSEVADNEPIDRLKITPAVVCTLWDDNGGVYARRGRFRGFRLGNQL